jgi:hypothetical protein
MQRAYRNRAHRPGSALSAVPGYRSERGRSARRLCRLTISRSRSTHRRHIGGFRHKQLPSARAQHAPARIAAQRHSRWVTLNLDVSGREREWQLISTLPASCRASVSAWWLRSASPYPHPPMSVACTVLPAMRIVARAVPYAQRDRSGAERLETGTWSAHLAGTPNPRRATQNGFPELVTMSSSTSICHPAAGFGAHNPARIPSR